MQAVFDFVLGVLTRFLVPLVEKLFHYVKDIVVPTLLQYGQEFLDLFLVEVGVYEKVRYEPMPA